MHSENFVLLVWEENPEGIKFYLIPEAEASEHRKFLDLAQNQMINNDDMNDGMCFLNTALTKKEMVNGFEPRFEPGFEKFNGIWDKYLVAHNKPIIANITKVYNPYLILFRVIIYNNALRNIIRRSGVTIEEFYKVINNL